jgi:predicted nucleotidyltransferase
MLTKKEIQFFKELKKQKIPFIVVGLSAAALQGASVVTQDVDLWFGNLSNPKIAKAIQKCGGFYVPPMMEMQTPPRFAGDDFETLDIVTTMDGLHDFKKEYADAFEMIVEGVRLKVLPLKRIIVSKKKAGRQKDKIVMPALQAALAAAERI